MPLDACAAIAVLDAIGWAPDPALKTVEVPPPDQPVSVETRRELDITRTAIAHLNAIIANAGRSELQ